MITTMLLAALVYLGAAVLIYGCSLSILVVEKYFANFKMGANNFRVHLNSLFTKMTVDELVAVYSVCPEAFYLGWFRQVIICDWIEHPEQVEELDDSEEAYISRPSAKYIFFWWGSLGYLKYVMLKFFNRLFIPEIYIKRDKILADALHEVKQRENNVREENL